MREELVALAKLAEMDDSARDIDAELKQIPQRLEELRHSVQMLETMLSQERQQLTEAEGLKAQQSAELKERGEGLQRARKKIAQSSSIREADAAEREVEANRRAIKEREDEIGRIAQAIEAKKASLAEREKDFEDTKSSLQADEETSKARIAELEEQRSKLLARSGRARRQGLENDRQALRTPEDGHPQRGHHHHGRELPGLPYGFARAAHD